MQRETMLIEPNELPTRMDNPNLRIFDATIQFFRTESEATAFDDYQQQHIPGAAFFDHLAFSDTGSPYMYMVPPTAELARQIGQIGISADSEVVFYTMGYLPCATRAWWLLHYAGHNNVRVLNGGLDAWVEAGGPVAQGVQQYPSTTFVTNLRPGLLAGREEVQAALADGRVCTVVHTLPEDNYATGHITGSSSLPCDLLMEGMSTFLPNDVLSARLRSAAQHERIITYCGGGIAATVNAMAHLMTGHTNVAVYDGSMDEWTKQNLPTTTIS